MRAGLDLDGVVMVNERGQFSSGMMARVVKYLYRVRNRYLLLLLRGYPAL